MVDSEPDFKIRVLKYTYAGGSGANTIFLHSPQESEDKTTGTLVLRQVNSDAENKVWIQEQSNQEFRRCYQGPGLRTMDNAHGIIVRDGQTTTVPRHGEEPNTYHYKRGDLIWVERSLVPTNNTIRDENSIPVIGLASLKLFEIPYNFICFVPQLIKRDKTGDRYASTPGSVINTFQGKRKTKTRIYFHWSATKPEEVSYMWLNLKNKDDLKTMRTFSKLEDPVEQRQVFRDLWGGLTTKHAQLGLLIGDEIVQGDIDRFESSAESDSESPGDGLSLHWKPNQQENCCNLHPCPSANDPELDLVPKFVGGYRFVEHYHVKDNDIDECPRGDTHHRHCILRDEMTTCAYANGRSQHTCCKLRTNALPFGISGNSGDASMPLWESNTNERYYIVEMGNMQTRGQRRDRDDVSLQTEQLRRLIPLEQANSPDVDGLSGDDEDDDCDIEMLTEKPLGQRYTDADVISKPTTSTEQELCSPLVDFNIALGAVEDTIMTDTLYSTNGPDFYQPTAIPEDHRGEITPDPCPQADVAPRYPYPTMSMTNQHNQTFHNMSPNIPFNNSYNTNISRPPLNFQPNAFSPTECSKPVAPQPFDPTFNTIQSTAKNRSHRPCMSQTFELTVTDVYDCVPAVDTTIPFDPMYYTFSSNESGSGPNLEQGQGRY
ncbi:hypothetical protein G7046_g4663 [Stylonectria norvegica]|nr:hypothetical protein G7046_g4663 [Stylonectria norvegica]